MLLHFYSDNCVYCDRLEAGAFQAPQVGQAIGENFVPVKIHANSAPELTKMFKVTKFPTDVVVTTAGKKIATKSVLKIQTITSPCWRAPCPPPSNRHSHSRMQLQLPSPHQKHPQTHRRLLCRHPRWEHRPRDHKQRQLKPQQHRPMDSPFQIPPPPRCRRDQSLPPNHSWPVSETIADSYYPAINQNTVAMVPAENPTSPGSAVSVGADPELAMEGFCAVTVIAEDRWVEGKPEHGVIHLGKLYLFENEDAMNTFLADPVPYTPVLNEIDVVRFFEERVIVPGKREWGVKDPSYQRMFFFADEAAMNHFIEEHHRYTDAAVEVMEKAVKDANPES